LGKQSGSVPDKRRAGDRGRAGQPARTLCLSGAACDGTGIGGATGCVV